jgi:hypothetical protein
VRDQAVTELDELFVTDFREQWNSSGRLSLRDQSTGTMRIVRILAEGNARERQWTSAISARKVRVSGQAGARTSMIS